MTIIRDNIETIQKDYDADSNLQTIHVTLTAIGFTGLASHVLRRVARRPIPINAWAYPGERMDRDDDSAHQNIDLAFRNAATEKLHEPRYANLTMRPDYQTVNGGLGPPIQELCNSSGYNN